MKLPLLISPMALGIGVTAAMVCGKCGGGGVDVLSGVEELAPPWLSELLSLLEAVTAAVLEPGSVAPGGNGGRDAPWVLGSASNSSSNAIFDIFSTTTPGAAGAEAGSRTSEGCGLPSLGSCVAPPVKVWPPAFRNACGVMTLNFSNKGKVFPLNLSRPSFQV
jgi:hypothetical protein